MSARRTRIKFCGLRREADLAVALELGVDAIGLIFADGSPRSLELADARRLRARIPPFVGVVALVRDTAPQRIADILDAVRPHWLQFHGSETDADCQRAGTPYLKAIGMQGLDDVPAALAAYPGAAGFVLDGHAPGAAGGSGQRFDWQIWPQTTSRPLILAGGLTADNVHEAIQHLRPWAVDVSSGIESAPGEKCAERMHRFVAEVRRADAA